MGHTKTVAAPKKATLAGEVSTKLKDCVMYPRAVKHPQSRAVGANFGSNLKRKGLNAKDASNIRDDVAADGVNASFMMAPRGKFVPYNIDANANKRRGPR